MNNKKINTSFLYELKQNGIGCYGVERLEWYSELN